MNIHRAYSMEPSPPINEIKKDTSRIINGMYDGLHFFDIYGGSFFIFLFLCLILFSVIAFTTIMKQIGPIKNDWAAQRCNPKVIPFAGFINKPDDSTIVEYTGENFNYCLQQILTSITGYAVDPLTFVTYGLQDLYNAISDVITSVRNIVSNVRTYIQNISQEIMQRIANIMVFIQKIMLAFRDSMQKVNGVLAAGMYTALGSYFTLKSFFGAFLQLTVIALIVMAALIITLMIFPIFGNYAIYLRVVFELISIPLVIIIAFLRVVMHIKFNSPIPSLPSCFDKDTKIERKDGSMACISEIRPGDLLKNNVEVTAVLQLDATNQELFNIYDIIVSGKHRVLYKDKWIYVSEHPDGKKIENNESWLYCLNTTSKTIDVGGILFCDWDEIFEKEIQILSKQMGFHMEKNKIHLWFHHGFSPDTTIPISLDESCKIKDIRVRQQLWNKENGANDITVYGIVTMLSEASLGQSVYHILTDKGFFYVKEEDEWQKRKDYNSCIESFL